MFNFSYQCIFGLFFRSNLYNNIIIRMFAA